MPELSVLTLTLRVAAVATAVVFPPAALIGYLLARHQFAGKSLVTAVLTLPLVLPPTAVGYLLLRLLADDGPLGARTLGLDLGLLLDWKGAVLAASVMGFPIVLRTARIAFEAIDPRLEAVARTLGHHRLSVLWRVTLPLCARGLGAAALLGFTRALGEFGATVMIAGNIPGRTQTLALALYSAEQAGRDAQAGGLLLVALAVGFVAVFSAEQLISTTPKSTATPP